MSSCSSCTPASQRAIVDLVQKAAKPDTNPVQDVSKVQKQEPSPADVLNTEGDRGTQLNVSA